MTLRFVSAGAAQGLVRSVAAGEGVDIDGKFGAVGAMLEHFKAGEPCDVVILTRSQVDQLIAEGDVDPATVRDVGPVATAIAVREKDPSPKVSDAASLKAALLACDAIYYPDSVKSTAGFHFAKVLSKLGIRTEGEARACTFPNGTLAMAALAKAGGQPIGCTQATEILATPGVKLVGPLPAGFDLSTTYTAAVSTRAADPRGAADFVARLTGPALAAARRDAGFQ